MNRFIATGALLVALASLTAACGGSSPATTPGSTGPTATVIVTALSPECEDALAEADALGESYAAYLGMTGELFTSISKLDWTSVAQQTDPIQAHLDDAVKTATAYGAARDKCRATLGTPSPGAAQ